MAKRGKEYFLMHKNIRVCLMEITDEGIIGRVRRNQSETDHFPLGGQMNNIAVMRNPDTLEILGVAPIFDSGNSMFYNIPYEKLLAVRLDSISTHSFIEKENRLLQYVNDRSLVDIELAQMDFSIYEKDIYERHMRIPQLTELYQRKLDSLYAFQNGKDVWKTKRY